MKDPIFTLIQRAKKFLQSNNAMQYIALKSKIKRQLVGHPQVYDEFSILLLFLVMAYKCRKSFRQFYEYLQYHPSIAKYCGLEKIPCRHTLVRRMKQLHNTFEAIVEFNGRYFIEKGYCNPKDIAVDCKAFKGRKGDKERSLLRTSYGWVRGYALTLVCSATKKNNIVFPLFAKTHGSKPATIKIFERMIYKLPTQTKFVLADSEYENIGIITKIERRDTQGYLIRRAVIAPRDINRMTSPLRIRNYQYYKSTRGQKKFARRLPSIESIYANLVETFNMPTVTIRGKKLACAFLSLLVVAYQILIWINIQQGSKQVYRTKYLISML